LISEAHRLFASQGDLPSRIESLSNVKAEDAASPSVVRELEALRIRMAETALPEEVTQAVRAFLSRSGLDDSPLAVRSSATVEDSAIASFAGVHRSRLNVRGAEEVLQAVKECYASLWTPQALAYRRRLQLADDEVACAVVICAMAAGERGEPEAAGVAFSCDPKSGRRDMVLISAVPGLGEVLVSGGATPEDIAVEHRDGRLCLVERHDRRGRVLSDDQAMQLARLVLRVHWALGDGQQPQDVEWAYAGGRFWLLQARPVTRVPHVTYPEIAALPVIWSNGNVNEVLPSVPSTMTWSSAQGTLRDILYESLQAVGYPVPRMNVCRQYLGRLYFDLTALQWAFYDALGLPPAETNRSVGGHHPEITLPKGSPLSSRATFQRLRYRAKLLRILRVADRSLPQEIERVHHEAREFRRLDLSSMSRGELCRCLERSVGITAAFFHRYMLGSSSAGAWHSMLETALKVLLPDRGEALAAALVAGTRGVTTAELGYRLVQLAKLAQQEESAGRYLRGLPLDPHGWRLLPSGSAFRKTMQDLLDEYGHRSVYESELANPRWSEDPSYLLEQVRVLLDSGEPNRRDQTARQTRAAAEAEMARLTWMGRPVLRWLTSRARDGAALRESGRSALMAAAACSRAVCLEVGRRMSVSGVLEAPQDVFHLSWVDVQSYLRGEWDGTGAEALIADRKRQTAEWMAAEAPDYIILDAEGRPAQLSPAFRPATRGAGGSSAGRHMDDRILIGLAGSAGRATGPCRIIRHPAEGFSLLEGEILVAPSTDPGWTPLFLRAGGVATQVGGHLSHAAIVAREYGLPAVLNVPGILEAVTDGQVVTVDGDSGRIIVHGQHP
jgi:pyruvate,water dikinase